MNAHASSSRRGIALLVSLVVVMSVSTLAVGLLQQAQSGSTASEFNTRSTQARLLVTDLTPRLLEWAAAETDSVFRAADDPSGWVPVFETDTGSLAIRIDAIDCSGRLRIDRLSTFARMGLPAPLQQLQVNQIREPNFKETKELRPLLESFANHTPDRSAIEAFSKSHTSTAQPGTIVLADWVTTHGSGALNITTAPLPLLKAALRSQDPSSAREILALRESGGPIPPSLIQQSSNSASDSSKRLTLTTTSSAVGFILTVTDHGSEQRWWIVAEQLTASQLRGALSAAYGADVSAISSWRITERRRIDR